MLSYCPNNGMQRKCLIEKNKLFWKKWSPTAISNGNLDVNLIFGSVKKSKPQICDQK